MTMLQETVNRHNSSDSMPGMRVSGMKCPICEGFIPIGVNQLLFDGGISCPHCGLSLTINRMQSKQALEALRKVEEAIENLRKASNFKY